MDGRTFARQLGAWVDPWRLLSLALDYSASPAELEERATATRQAWSFVAAREVGLDRLVRTFVEHFELPSGTVAILREQVAFEDRAIARFSGLRYTGEVSFENFDAASPAGTVAAFTGRKLEILAIAGPINFLIGLVDSIAAMWASLPRGQAFYEPSFHTELAVYVEACVARALGFRLESAWTSGRPGENARPATGVVTMVGSPPFDRQAVAKGWATARGKPVPPPRPAAATAARAVFEEGDDLVLLEPGHASEPWHNIERFRNECSPLSGVEKPVPRGDGRLLVDTQYGRAFDFVLTEESAVYGFSEDLAKMSPPAKMGYLRVPYRSVPRIPVRSRAELDAIVASVCAQLAGSLLETRLLLRGQSHEYFLQRSSGALKALYGDPMAREPSLPASAVRKGQALEEVLPEWCFLIRCYSVKLHLLLMNLSPPDQRERLTEAMHADRTRFERSLDTHALAFSLAQHYGLPSMGLDLTDRVEAALFFALHEFQPAAGRTLRIMPGRGNAPVVYLFAMPERFCVEHARVRPRIFQNGRPDAQAAWFSHMGWGYRRNQCAEYLVAALYPDPGGDFGTLPSARELFPAPPEDAFGSFMESVLANGSPSPSLRGYLEQLYWLEDAGR